MAKKKVLYISGSLGLGHIVRDLAIANALRDQNSDIELSWIAAHPASLLLKEAGENLLPEADKSADDNIPAEKSAKEGYKLNLLNYLSNAMGAWKQNVKVFQQVISREQFDLVIADEAYEIAIALMDGKVPLEAPFVMIYDFFGNDSVTKNPVERFINYMWNRTWTKIHKFYSVEKNLGLFIGELEDIPDKSLGFLLPNRRNYAKANLEFVGYVLQFDPSKYTNKEDIRKKLDYGEEPLVVCAIGGTSVGKELLRLCGQAFPIVKEKISNLHMVMVCGPRLEPKSLDVPKEIDVRGYIPALYEHLAACDLAIVQGGGTTTLELTALRRPFLYFPLEDHFEQQVHVAGRLERHQAGVKMSHPHTTPEILAEKIIANLGKKVTYANIPTDGGPKAAKLISRYF